MRLSDWPEPLPDPSPPPGHEATRGAGATAAQLDPGHLMTEQEWQRVQADALELERLELEEADHAG